MGKQKNAPTEHLDPVQKKYMPPATPASGGGGTKNAGLSSGELPSDLPRSGVAK